MVFRDLYIRMRTDMVRIMEVMGGEIGKTLVMVLA